MRTTSLFAFTCLCLPVVSSLQAQSATQPALYWIANEDPSDPPSSNWSQGNANDPTTLKFKITGDVGGWARLIVSASDPDQDWLERPAQYTFASVQNPHWNHQPASPNFMCRLVSLDLNQAIDRASTHPFYGEIAVESAQDWYLPILESGSATTNDVFWRADAASWQDSDLGVEEYGLTNAAEWEAVTVGHANDDSTPFHFCPDALFKAGIMRRATAPGGIGGDAAHAYLNSQDYETAALTGDLKLEIAAIVMRQPGLPFGDGGTDAATTPLPAGDGDPFTPPLAFVTASAEFRHRIPPPQITDFNLPTGSYVPGAKLQFRARNVVTPLWVQVPIVGGTRAIRALARASQTDPLLYVINLPLNLVTGQVLAATSRTGGWYHVADITAVAPSGN